MLTVFALKKNRQLSLNTEKNVLEVTQMRINFMFSSQMLKIFFPPAHTSFFHTNLL